MKISFLVEVDRQKLEKFPAAGVLLKLEN